MNHLRRVVLPALLVTVALVTASCAGSSGTSTSSTHHGMPMPEHSANGMGGMPGMTETRDTGTSSTSGGYGLTLAAATAPARTPVTLRFTISRPDGRPLTDYVVDQTKKLHLYVIRSDLTGYQHLHPLLGTDGGWSTPITFDEPGDYRVIADFVAATGGAETHHVLGASFTVAGPWTKATLPAPTGRAAVDGYTVTLSGEVRSGVESPIDVRISRAGRPVTDLRPYLGVWAHLGAFQEGTVAVTHLHPTEQPMQGTVMDSPEVLRFDAMLSAPGNYRVFVQFQTGGRLHTAALTVRAR